MSLTQSYCWILMRRLDPAKSISIFGTVRALRIFSILILGANTFAANISELR
jgi:hypothetical protein